MQAEGLKLALEGCYKIRLSELTSYCRKKKFVGIGVAEVCRALEEDWKLKDLVVLSLDSYILQDVPFEKSPRALSTTLTLNTSPTAHANAGPLGSR